MAASKSITPPATTLRPENPEAKRFVQVKTVIMMSDAWRDCDYSARCAFLELSARLQWVYGQTEPVNNGRLWLSREEWNKAGFSSATVTRSIKKLIKNGLIYRTRTGGIGRGCNEFALTCYSPTKDTSGLYFQGFRKNAWDKFVTPPPKKNLGSKVNRRRFSNDELPPQNSKKEIKSKQAPAINFKQQESKSTNLTESEAHRLRRVTEHSRHPPSFRSRLLIRQTTTADRGLQDAPP